MLGRRGSSACLRTLQHPSWHYFVTGVGPVLVLPFLFPVDFAMASTLSAEQMTDIKKIESPLHAKLNAAGVSDVTMAHLGKVGVTSIAMLTAVADDRKDLRKFLLESCQMYPSMGTSMVVEIGRIVVVYDQCGT